jgi:membrane protein
VSTLMIGFLGAAFSVALMLGLWGEEAYRRTGSSWWVPAALGLLRAEVTTVQGLLILLVVRPVSWVPAAGLALVAVWSGVVRFVQMAQPEAWAQRRWAWLIPYAVLVVAWIVLVGVFLPVPGALGERLVTASGVAAVMCVFFLGVRLLARGAASLNSGARPSEYVAAPVPERASRS